MTDKIDRAELRRLCEAATPGPWQWVKDGCECFARGIHIHETYEDDPPIVRLENFREEENAAFIAAARTAIPALLDALDAAEARERRLLADLASISDIAHAGGLAGLDSHQALSAIRRRTLPAWDKSGPEAEQLQRVRAALAETAP